MGAGTRGGVVSAAVRGWRTAAWWWNGVIGADAYARYLESHRRRHGAGQDHPPMSEREFWRERVDAQDRNPQGRCC